MGDCSNGLKLVGVGIIWVVGAWVGFGWDWVVLLLNYKRFFC